MDNIVFNSYKYIGDYLKEINFSGKIMVISDKNVEKLYMDDFINTINSSLHNIGNGNNRNTANTDLEKSFNSLDISIYKYIIEEGENSKNIFEYKDICEKLCDNEFGRRDLVIVLGGGVVGDLAGFVAATYQRGIGFIQIPTTLLSQVDSSVGSKTAINLDKAKNQIGAFYDAQLVLIDIKFLKTLDKKEFFNGFAEVIKYGAISEDIFQLLERSKEDILCFINEKNSNGEYVYIDDIDNIKTTKINYVENNVEIEILGDIVEKCVRCKSLFVEKDKFDNGMRKILNFGHTIGHSIEISSGFKISHGYAVAKGMAYIAKKSLENGILSDKDYKRFIGLLEFFRYNLDIYEDIQDKNSLRDAIRHDKKRSFDEIDVVYIEKIGKCVIKNVNIEEII